MLSQIPIWQILSLMRVNSSSLGTTGVLLLLQRAVFFVVLTPIASAWAQPGGEDPANQYYRYNNAELEAVCAAMSPQRYVGGLTEGAWVALPSSGRTYYYRSACYLELVRRTGRAELCNKVVERRTLLGNGSSHTPQRCAELAQAFQALQQKNAQDRAAQAQSMVGVFKITQVQVNPLANGNWRLDVIASGTQPGDYILQVRQVREGRVVLEEEAHALAQAKSWRWELNRATIVGNTPLPNIFPMSVTISRRISASGSAQQSEQITSIQNFTLSAIPAAPSGR